MSQFNWDDAQIKHTPKFVQLIAEERGVSEATIEGLLKRDFIGGVFVEKWKEEAIAFPVHDDKGHIWRAHCRRLKSKDWTQVPDKNPEGRRTPALVYGVFDTANRIYVFESQWDAITLIDVFALFPDIDRGEVCLVSTRGANTYTRLTHLCWVPETKVYAFPHNDDPGRTWLEKVIEITDGARVVETPEAYSDLGEWVKDGGADAMVIVSALESAVFKKPPARPDGETSKNGDAPREPRKLTGKSIIDFAESQIDLSQCLLGSRWLSRRTGGFIVAPSGHGKSTLVIQAASSWSCGRVAFAIKPIAPLRILIVQSEDDDNDVTEMAQMVDRLNLTADEKNLVRANTRVEWLNDVTGDAFFAALDDFLTEFPADIVFINPYTAYTGGDIQDDKLNSKFLRVDLTKVITAHKCAAVPVHHTPKTSFQNTDKFSWFDWMYSMAGGATLTNWARAVLVIAPTETPGTYRFIAAKRFEKIGWQDREYWFAHSIEGGKILWVPASQDQIAGGRKGKNATPEDLLSVIPMIDAVRIETITVNAWEKLKIGEKKVRRFLRVLQDVEKAFEHSFPRPGIKPEIKYARTRQ
jgi:AAA domain